MRQAAWLARRSPILEVSVSDATGALRRAQAPHPCVRVTRIKALGARDGQALRERGVQRTRAERLIGDLDLVVAGARDGERDCLA